MLNTYLRYLQEAGFDTLPKGWTQKSVKKSGQTLAKTLGKNSPKDKGFFEKCVERMRKHMGDGAEGYCASQKDEAYGSTHWRGKDKTKKQTAIDVKKHQNVR